MNSNLKIPITRPYIPAEAEKFILEPLRSGWLTQGPKVAEFQDAIADLCQVKFAQATTSCTTALFLALTGLGIERGDEVITTPYSFIATANVIIHRGAKPVFVDINLDNYNLEPELIEPAITERTKGIMIVHQIGLPADIDRIKQVAELHGLWVLEDAACALGAKYKNRPIGGGTAAACFSFHPRKLVTTGEGGMIVTDDEFLISKCRSLVSHGATIAEEKRHTSKKHIDPHYTDVGYNYRMSDIQAALGLAQLPVLEWQIEQRTRLAQRYTQAFENDKRIIPPSVPPHATPNYQSYMLRLPYLSAAQRNWLIESLRTEGIASNPGITGIPFEPVYRECSGPANLPNCQEAMATTLILPLFPQMTEADQNKVIEALFAALNGLG